MAQIYTRSVITPLHERPSSIYEHHNPDLYTPREFQRPDLKASQQQFREALEGSERTQTQQPLRSPMSDSHKGRYEVTTPKARGMYQPRPEPGHKSREQLPPLSSLFGSPAPSHRSRPAPLSSYSESRSPVFPAVSPQDPRHPPTSVHSDRSYDSSYSQRPPLSLSGHYSYHGPEQVERLGIPPPPRTTQHAYRPESPRHDGQYDHLARTQAPPTGSSWSPQSQAGRPEFFAPRDTSSSFRAHPEHRHQLPSSHRHEPESTSAYRDGHISAPATPTYPPTPASTVAADPTTTKDGLGPKIWTGTQFLPRFVRQAEVPGEGLCYFYDDGTHCKTVIDGEGVNAHWGVTKAGKPRKRLAIACITCREKKIKCDPDYPRCVQCEKFGRVCKFKNAPRGGHGSPDTPPADGDDVVSRPVSSRGDLDSITGVKRESSHSVSPRQVLRQGSADSETHHSKRQRNDYTDFTPVASEASPRLSVHEAESPASAWAESAAINNATTNLFREWHTHPAITHPTLVGELMTVFFRHVPETAYCMFPEAPFRAWVTSTADKSEQDLMLVYSVLALGTIFSPKPEHKAYINRFASIARFACTNIRQFSIQLVQSRLLLALYYFSDNKPEDAWDFCGASLRAASGLRMNLEIEKTEDHYLQVYPYGLNRAGFAECRRRTFWSCYLMDRFDGFCSGHVSIARSEDVFLRFPCDFTSFQAQADVKNPFFDPCTPPIENINWTIGSMAYLINVATIWGDVMANIYRTSHRPHAPTQKSPFAATYDNAMRRLQSWQCSLPSCYTFSAENLARAAYEGKLSTYITMHTVYHTTAMKLNRYIQQYTLTKSQLERHVGIAKEHAEDLLIIMDTLAARIDSASSNPDGQDSPRPRFSSPFVGYGIVSAIDILTAKVPLQALPARLASFKGSQSVIADIADFWQSAKNQHGLVAQRIHDLTELARTRDGQLRLEHPGANAREVNGLLEMREAMEKTFAMDYDCFYHFEGR